MYSYSTQVCLSMCVSVYYIHSEAAKNALTPLSTKSMSGFTVEGLFQVSMSVLLCAVLLIWALSSFKVHSRGRDTKDEQTAKAEHFSTLHFKFLDSLLWDKTCIG